MLAIAARFGSPSSLSVLIGVVNIIAIMIAVALPRRRGGVPLMLACALALALLSRSWSAETLHDIWNPSAALSTFTLLLFLCWSLACGEYRLLPLTALAASFTIQSELTFLAPTLAVVAIGVGGLSLWRAQSAGANQQPGRPRLGGTPERARAPRVWPWALAALLVLAACWAAPVIDQLEHTPGNLAQVLRAAEAREPKQGLTVGWHAVARAVGVAPWWLKAPSGPFARYAEVRTPPGSLATLGGVARLSPGSHGRGCAGP